MTISSCRTANIHIFLPHNHQPSIVHDWGNTFTLTFSSGRGSQMISISRRLLQLLLLVSALSAASDDDDGQ